ncbi:LOW QUALITY PROTEIN: protein mono-ADP-ribosyltransferase PARP6-like [Pecten maximus]|uniref:LOW QUALITY PROTEIN: protein mono-ADP-ribosyltransferase PARP6-like n=1 Tax=Pecten maximus TaxID=6579 RepID=UPI0014589DB0|nr:LOW QUALITY PROTEIN: protein mono-ADP-ribosyltransferase PARP6-like [Pecten maximus]
MSSRQKKFEDDIKTAIQLIAEEQWPVHNFEIAGKSLTFMLNKNDDLCEFSIVTSDEYPENTFIYRGGDFNNPVISNNAIPAILSDCVKCTGSILQTTLVQRTISMESEASNYEDAASNLGDSDNDNQEEDMEDYYNDEEMSMEVSVNPLLDTDMEKLTNIHGDSVLSYRLLDSIDEIDIELNIELAGFIAKEIAEAWGLNSEEPLVIRIHLSLTTYLDTPNPPKVEAFQPSKKEKCGVGSQMRKILESYLSQNWPKLSNEKLEAIHNFQERTMGMSSMETSQSSNTLSSAPITVDDRDLARLMEMGFSDEQARNALILNRGDILKASNDLFINSEGKQKLPDGPEKTAKAPPVKGTMRQTSHPPILKKIKRGFGRQTSSIATASGSKEKTSQGQTSTDLTLVPSSYLAGENAKRVPSLEHGFLVQMFQYIRQRIPTLNEYCVVCDEPHVFQNGAMLKPAVCSRELCVFAFQTLGVMSDAAEDIATGAEVVDLLVAMTRAACGSNRKAVIFEPYPTIVDPRNNKELAFNPKSKDYTKVENALEGIISMQEMTRLGAANMRKKLDDNNIYSYSLLQWIITSNRSHIVKLPADKQISFMRTPHQFLLLSSPPAKEATFRECKQQHGSTFAFHGSGIENWHSIIREGLIVASGTNKQVNGAAYGKGVYLSPNANVSFGYSRMGYGGHKVKADQSQSKSRFLSSNNITCIALCEVITAPNLKKSGNIWVSPSGDHVCTRFFFVYEDGQVGDSDINTQVDKYKKEIDKAVGFRTC